MGAQWFTAWASRYDYSPTYGACGDLNDGRFHFAELGTATLGGVATGDGRLAHLLGVGNELPCGFGLWIMFNGRTTYATKMDRGYGGPTPVSGGGQGRDIDLYYNLADWLHFDGVQQVRVSDGRGGPPPTGAPISSGDASPQDVDWTPYLEHASGSLGLHGRKARANALFVESMVGNCSYVTTDGPHFGR